jgi:hypothetical protein
MLYMPRTGQRELKKNPCPASIPQGKGIERTVFGRAQDCDAMRFQGGACLVNVIHGKGEVPKVARWGHPGGILAAPVPRELYLRLARGRRKKNQGETGARHLGPPGLDQAEHAEKGQRLHEGMHAQHRVKEARA